MELTPEQETELRNLANQQAGLVNLGQVADFIATPPTQPDSVRIHIDPVTFAITSNCPPLPSYDEIKFELNRSYQAKLRKKYRWDRPSLTNAIAWSSRFMSLQDWSDAIGKVTMQRLANANGATTELRNISQGGYLAVGDTLYKLSAVGMVSQTKALAVTRKRILEKVQVEAKAVKTEAEIAAKAIVSQATYTRQEADDYKRRIENSTALPPQDLATNGFPLKFKNNRWEIQIAINIQLSAFNLLRGHGTYSWAAIPADLDRKWHLWVPISADGRYSITSIYVDRDDPKLPHISHAGACMAPSPVPEKILQYEDLMWLQDEIKRCMSVVQLDSLYSSFNGSQWKLFKAAIPPLLYDKLLTSGLGGAVQLISTPNHGGATFTSNSTEDQATWDSAHPPVVQPEVEEETARDLVQDVTQAQAEATMQIHPEDLEEETPGEWNTQVTPTA